MSFPIRQDRIITFFQRFHEKVLRAIFIDSRIERPFLQMLTLLVTQMLLPSFLDLLHCLAHISLAIQLIGNLVDITHLYLLKSWLQVGLLPPPISSS